jgi:Tol biopolymer transport system component
LKTSAGEKKLTEGSNWHLYPDISSDGKSVVYVSGADQKNLQLHLMDLTDKKSEILSVPMKGMILHPKLTKNNQYVFFSAPVENKNSIFAIDLKDNKKLIEITPSEEAYFPRPSSDGLFVVYQRNINEKKEIVFYDRLENKKEVIINNPTSNHERYRNKEGIIIEKRFNLFRPTTYKVLFKDKDVQIFNKIQMCEFYKEELDLFKED